MALRKLYAAPLVDEGTLRRNAATYVASQSGEIPSNEELLAISNKHGMDFSTAVLYEALRQHPVHGLFIDNINQQSSSPAREKKDIKLLIVPGLFYKEHPEIGGDGSLVLELARQCGILAELVPTKSLGSISENAEILESCIRNESHPELWLVAFSKGASEVRLLMDRLAERSDSEKRVKGWINICGILNGTPLANRKLGNVFSRGLHAVLYTLLGISYKGLTELATDHPYWQKPLDLPDDVELINIVGTPLQSHLQPYLMSRARRLESCGPNDGVIVLRNTIPDIGKTYPVWGADHFFRQAGISNLLVKLFNYITNENSSAINHTNNTIRSHYV